MVGDSSNGPTLLSLTAGQQQQRSNAAVLTTGKCTTLSCASAPTGRHRRGLSRTAAVPVWTFRVINPYRVHDLGEFSCLGEFSVNGAVSSPRSFSTPGLRLPADPSRSPDTPCAAISTAQAPAQARCDAMDPGIHRTPAPDLTSSGAMNPGSIAPRRPISPGPVRWIRASIAPPRPISPGPAR